MGASPTANGVGRAGSAAGAARATTGQRVFAVGVAAVCLGGLVVAAWLTPDPAGHGTHVQLGLSECGWLVATGHPCPTCGMTTAVSLAADGRLLDAAVTQPAGMLAAVLAAAVFWGAVHVAATGSRLGTMFARLLTPRAVTAMVAACAVAWVYTLATWPAREDTGEPRLAAPEQPGRTAGGK